MPQPVHSTVLFRRCLRLLGPARWHLVALIAGFGVLALLLAVPALLLLDILWTRVLQGQPLSETAAAFLRFDTAAVFDAATYTAELRKSVARRALLVILALTLASAPLFAALLYYRVWILQRINHLLRLQLMERLQALSLRFHADSRVGDAIYRVYQDSAMVTQLIDVVLVAPLMAIGRLLFSLVIVCMIDPVLALLLLCIWPPAVVAGLWFTHRMRPAFQMARATNSRLTSRIQESIAAAKVLKANGAAPAQQKQFEADSRTAFAAAFEARRLFAEMTLVVLTISTAGLVLATGWSALAAANGAELFAKRFFVASGVMVWNVGLFSFAKDRFSDGAVATRRLFRSWALVQDIGVGLQRVFDLLDLEPEVRDAADAVAMSPLRSSVAFRAVSFAYEAGRPALEDISFDVRRGAITALVGPSGSGKTTLMALLLRLVDPQSGAVTIDGVDIRRLRVDSLRAHIGVALQESPLFQASVRDNIAYANPGASDAAIRAAAQIACASEFIERLPLGYDTVLGERGSKLSVGQRQRLNIARAVLKDTSILLLDEPTAALDADTELQVLRNLTEWGRDRAILIVTHRLSTIRQADEIVVLQQGRVVERGSHAGLIAAAGAYHRLVTIESVITPATGGA